MPECSIPCSILGMATRKNRRPSAPGIMVRERADGSFSFTPWIPTGKDGGKRALPVQRTLEAAVALRERALHHLNAMPRVGITLTEAADEARLAMERRGVRPATLHWFDDHRTRAIEAFGAGTPLAKLTPRVIEAAVDDWRKKVAPATILHRRRWLSLVFRHAVREGWIIEDPLPRVTWPRAERSVRPFFSPEEVATILQRIRAHTDRAAEHDAAVVELLYLTGWRRAELARLRLGDVDLRKRVVAIAGKTENEAVALGKRAAECLAILIGDRTDPAEFLVGVGDERGRATTIGKMFARWSERLDLRGFTPHSLRHSFASAVVARTGNLGVAAMLTRHKTLAMLQRYTHALSEHRETLDAIADDMTVPTKEEVAPKRPRLRRVQ